VALQEDYFTKDRQGNKVDFYKDCFLPFVKRWDQAIEKTKMKGKMRMVAPVPNEYCPEWPVEQRPKNFVYAPHWYVDVAVESQATPDRACADDRYDLNALFKKQFGTMTVNVQGLSRVSRSSLHLSIRSSLTSQGMFFFNALYFGREGAKKNYAKQIRNSVGEARKQIGEVPIVFGECGVPMDMK
jgi:hypothetical protein